MPFIIVAPTHCYHCSCMLLSSLSLLPLVCQHHHHPCILLLLLLHIIIITPCMSLSSPLVHYYYCCPHQEKLKIHFYTFFHFFSLFCKKVKKVKKRKVFYLSNYFFNQSPKVHALLQVKSLQQVLKAKKSIIQVKKSIIQVKKVLYKLLPPRRQPTKSGCHVR